MTRAYSQDLRDRVIAALEDEGLSRGEAARRYRISVAAAVRWLQAPRQGRHAPPAQGGDRRSRLTADRGWLLGLIAAEPDPTLLGVAERHLAEHDVEADAGMLNRFFKDNGISLEEGVYAPEQLRPDVVAQREAWQAM